MRREPSGSGGLAWFPPLLGCVPAGFRQFPGHVRDAVVDSRGCGSRLSWETFLGGERSRAPPPCPDPLPRPRSGSPPLRARVPAPTPQGCAPSAPTRPFEPRSPVDTLHDALAWWTPPLPLTLEGSAKPGQLQSREEPNRRKKELSAQGIPFRRSSGWRPPALG